MAGFDISDGIYKAFLAGVGAVASGAEKGQQVIDEFVKKGQITVEQGKNLNSELTRKVKETFDATVSGASDSADAVAEDAPEAAEDAVEPDATE